MAPMAHFRGLRMWWPRASWRAVSLLVGLGTFLDPGQSGEKGLEKVEGSGFKSPSTGHC